MDFLQSQRRQGLIMPTKYGPGPVMKFIRDVGSLSSVRQQHGSGHRIRLALGVCIGAALLSPFIQASEAKQDSAPATLDEQHSTSNVRMRSTSSKNAFFVPVKPQPEAALYCFGDNDGLTVPGCAEIRAPYPLAVPCFDRRGVQSITFGQRQAAAVTKKGDVYAWGALYEADGAIQSDPRLVVSGGGVIDMACGGDALYCLASGGHVYKVNASTDAVEHPQNIGWFSGGVTVTQPEGLALREKIVQLTSGKGHLMALTNKGQLFGMVYSDTGNSLGQLGLGHTEPVKADVWHKVDLAEGDEVVEVACGSNHTLALTEKNDILTFGHNNLLQLGQGEFDLGSVGYTALPTRINTPWWPNTRTRDSKVLKIAAGGDCSAVVLQSQSPQGVVLKMFGSGLSGTLGNSQYRHAVGIPTSVKTVSGLTQYDEGSQSTTAITVKDLCIGEGSVCVTLDTDDTYAWGANARYQLGDSTIVNRSKPVLVLSKTGDRGYMQIPVKGEDTKVVLAGNNGAVFKK
ncbi:hypothetical protein SARC_04331 [Sphaeroforma arctica JP610]|uniref:Regulator of chromosome condensation n=1 Tax=Sphaeroforma arctica JP610 TaxID=667725 RepID=A0A0L0G3G7_9EUKA|nr:hypothetical protein SARC_04331 [Sphaeroforma arctica JP610]KNC83414.1 hypothetical protein SARC_04331 [Sphaeroforma arctica JP610]|eukprot:XP_014157316.1 hypothetical protein SARC_04331 [Sphaeroforma arctica JP610]